MRRVLAVLLMAPMLTGCALLSRAVPPEASMPPGEPLVTMGYGPDGPVWPGDELPPGEYRADWVNGCTASASLQGATILTTDDPPTGSRIFTIEPNMDGTNFSSMCPPGASLVIEVRKPQKRRKPPTLGRAGGGAYRASGAVLRATGGR